jgi:hypothetical protein
LEEKSSGANDEDKLFVQQGLDEQPRTCFERGINEATQVMATVYRGAGTICRKIGITFLNL